MKNMSKRHSFLCHSLWITVFDLGKMASCIENSFFLVNEYSTHSNRLKPVERILCGNIVIMSGNYF